MKYFNLVDVRADFITRSQRDLCTPDLQKWHDLVSGKQVSIAQCLYAMLIEHNSKWADIAVSAIEDGAEFDAARIVICLHSRYKQKAWQRANGHGQAPEAPFIAVYNIDPIYSAMPQIDDFAEAVAWAFLEK